MILSAQLTGHALDDETARWLASRDQEMTEKLAAVGLAERKEQATLKAFIDNYVSSRSDIKDRSVSRIREAGEKLIACFGATKRLRDFSSADGPKFRQWLLGKGLAENTVRRNCGRAKQFFRAAIRQKLAVDNPFFQNLRSTRETELMESFPAHVVCAWIGNSEAVAQKHYLQVTDDHFLRALRSADPGAPAVAKTAPPSGEAVQNPVQYCTASARTAPHAEMTDERSAFVLQGLTSSCDVVNKRSVPLRGEDQSIPNSQKTQQNPKKNVFLRTRIFLSGRVKFGPFRGTLVSN